MAIELTGNGALVKVMQCMPGVGILMRLGMKPKISVRSGRLMQLCHRGWANKSARDVTNTLDMDPAYVTIRVL